MPSSFRDDGVPGGYGQVAPRGSSGQAALSPIGPELVSLAPGLGIESSCGDEVHLRSKHDHPLNPRSPSGSSRVNFAGGLDEDRGGCFQGS